MHNDFKILNKERVVPGEDEYSFRRHIERYKFAQNYVRGKRVLSVACGVGYGEYMLITKGQAKNVLGLDYSDEAIKYAQENFSYYNLKFIKKDARDLSDIATKKFDIIISFETIEHLINDKKFLNALKRLLVPEGILLISTPNRARSFRNLFKFRPIDRYHVREYKKEQFLTLLKQYFEQVDLYGQKIIIKRSLSGLPKYLYLKITKKLEKIEKDDLTVKTYPKNEEMSSCSFLAVCKN